MKKYLSILAVVLAVFSLTACKSSNAPKSAIEAIKERGKLVLLTEATFPPFEYGDSSEGSVDGVNGVDIEFGKMLAAKLGVELEVINLDFNTLIDALNAGKGDLIAAGMGIKPEREEVVDFSIPYYDNALYIIVPASSDITSVDGLKGKTISVQQGTTGDDYAATIENTKLLQFKGMVEAGISVSTGKADASIMDLLPATVITKNQPSLKLIDQPLSSEKTALAVPKGSDLLELLNEMVTEVQNSGQLQKWFDSHFEAVVLD